MLKYYVSPSHKIGKYKNKINSRKAKKLAKPTDWSTNHQTDIGKLHFETSLWPSLSVRRSIGRSVIILHWVSSLPTLLSENLLLNEQRQLVGFKFTGKLMISRWFTTNYVWNTRNMAEILLFNTFFAVSNSLYWVYSEMWEWKEKEDGREGGWKTFIVLV